MAEEDKGYAWETEYEKSWEALNEDDAGLLQASVDEIISKAKRRRLLERPVNVQLGMMRHLLIIIDMSKSMEDQDLKPTRIRSTLKLVENFVSEYFDQNPVSQLGLAVTRNKRVEKITDLGGNRKRHLNALVSLKDSPCNGEASLQNSLEFAVQSLRHVPTHASRETLIVFGSLSTCDPGNIYDTVTTLKSNNIRCSIIGLSAALHVCQKICTDTRGRYDVIMEESHFRELLTQHVPPPAAPESVESSLIKMGFPHSEGSTDNRLSMCFCHIDNKQDNAGIGRDGYICPQCGSKYCDLPVECVICGLTLVSAPHLARSYRHLFPLAAYVEVNTSDLFSANRYCFGCQQYLSGTQAYKCESCSEVFCIDCDVFMHDSLHSCPGCANKRTTEH